MFLLQTVPEGIILRTLGALLVAFAAGVLGGAYNTNGPPLVVFGVLNRWPPQQFRATLRSVFFTSGIVIALGQLASGLWTQQALLLSVVALPAMPFAVMLGRRLNARIPQALFTQLLYVFLILLGARLLMG